MIAVVDTDGVVKRFKHLLLDFTVMIVFVAILLNFFSHTILACIRAVDFVDRRLVDAGDVIVFGIEQVIGGEVIAFFLQRKVARGDL